MLDNLSLEIDADEIVAVVGPSGCGKTTMLNIVADLEQADDGEVETNNAKIGYVFQEDRLLPWRTVRENIALVRDQSVPSEVDRLVAMLGLSGFASYYPGALSGGMRQRCSIARAYHFRCELLLMDEPFKSLDHNLRFDMLASLMNVRRENKNAVLFTTHDIDEALAVASRIVVLGKRPAHVVREFSLGSSETLRDVNAPELVALKRNVIELTV